MGGGYRAKVSYPAWRHVSNACSEALEAGCTNTGAQVHSEASLALPGRAVRPCVKMRGRGEGPGASRVVSEGVSTSQVRMPTNSASCLARNAWVQRRLAGPVRDHPPAPMAGEVRPSMNPSDDCAHFKVTQGDCFVMLCTKAAFSRRASSSRQPTSHVTPACCNRSTPRPATSGLGSFMATTTRPTPRDTSRSAHGGVLPVWLQGSRVT